MPVIGRLDDQVEAILINPLRRPTPDETRLDESPRPAAPDEDVDIKSPDESPREGRERDAALPVWLL